MENTQPCKKSSASSEQPTVARTSKEWLNENIFFGLQDKNKCKEVESAGIKYFNEIEFSIVLQRCDTNDVTIMGIEQWIYNGNNYNFYYCETQTSIKGWHWNAFKKLTDQEEAGYKFLYCATYSVNDGASKSTPTT